MEPVTIRSIGRYDRMERRRQIFQQTGLCLGVSGLRSCRVTDPQGQLVWEAKQNEPFLGLILPGMCNDFDYGRNRLNWVAMFDGVPVRWGQHPGEADIRCGEDWVTVPFRFQVSANRAEDLQRRFERMLRAFRAPTPAARFLAQTDLFAVLGTFVEQAGGVPGETPAERLKSVIDAEPGGRETLDHMATRCGYSADHLRRLFVRRFHTTPREYRAQSRAAFAMDLLANTELTVAEVAERAGYAHPAHFARAFRAIHGMTPREAIRRYRFRQVSDALA
jgi:AraC-like DNA-binding protein